MIETAETGLYGAHMPGKKFTCTHMHVFATNTAKGSYVPQQFLRAMHLCIFLTTPHRPVCHMVC